jgi:hypothetical protein
MLKNLYKGALTLVALSLPAIAHAQGLETLGNRAAALAAFVAVADDSSAVAWNPSGLVSGPFFNITLGLGRTTDAPDSTPFPGAGGGRLRTTLIAVGTTPLGLAYYRIASTSIKPADPAVSGSLDRETNQAVVTRLVATHLGATVQQSVGEYLTLGATIKLVRGSVGQDIVSGDSWDAAFERGDSFEGQGNSRGDVDVGAMLAAGRIRAGVVIRNVTAPTFGEPDGAAVRLERHVRVGAAWADRWPGISSVVVAVDADLTQVPHPAGDRRDVAAGVERWLGGQRVGLRAGVRTSTVGDPRPVASAGGSLAVRGGTYVDAYLARGTRNDRGWGVAVRLGY